VETLNLSFSLSEVRIMYRTVNRARRGDGLLAILPNPLTRIELPPSAPPLTQTNNPKNPPKR
jgi:hypothetical protein